MLAQLAFALAFAGIEEVQTTFPNGTRGLSTSHASLIASAYTHMVQIDVTKEEIAYWTIGLPLDGSRDSLWLTDASSSSGPTNWLLTREEQNSQFVWVDALTGDLPIGTEYARDIHPAEINGDSATDLVQTKPEGITTTIHQWLSSPTGYAYTATTHPGELPFVVEDINNDNRSDLLVVENHFVEFSPYGTFSPQQVAQDSTLRLYSGGVDGFDTTEEWELKLDVAVAFALAIQLDADPEREILLFGSAGTTLYLVSSPQLLMVDPQPSGPPTVTYDPTFFYANTYEDIWDPDFQLINDSDADGIDDVVVRIGQELVLLGSATRFTWPTSLHVFTIQGINDPDLIEFLTHDVDADGFDDVVAIYGHEIGLSGEYTTTMKVWFGPFNEPEPVEETADTGQSIPQDTSGTSTTADTATAPPSVSTPIEPSKCGCSSDATAATLFLPLLTVFAVRRRHQRE